MSASNSSISSSSSSSSSGGNGRPREVVPKVDFSPNFQKHIPPRNPGPNGTPGVGPPAVDARQPQEPPQLPTRHVSVISPAIPPGYDKKTDAYMSANYRAVGGPLVTPAYQYAAGPVRGSPGAYDGSSAAASSSMASASSKSVYYPPTGQDFGRPAAKSGSGSIVTGQAAPAGPTNLRSNSSSQGPPSSSPAASQSHINDRMEDRKFVETNRPQGGSTHASPPQQGPSQVSPQGAPTYDKRYPNHLQGTAREGTYPSYGQAGDPYANSGKRPAAPVMSNGPAVHPSVITTNYHHHPQAVLQQQQQQQHQQQYAPDARYYPHHPTIPVKSREDHIMPVYHPPHLRGGSAASYSSPHAFGYSKDEPNVHPHYPPHQPDPMAYHKGPPGAPAPFRYGDSLKVAPPSEHPAIHHMQSHIHYTGASAGTIPKVGHGATHQYQQSPQSHPQQPQHHSTQSAESISSVPQYPPNVHPSYGTPQHHRGADQSVISKLRTSLELKEYEKQRINQLRKHPGMELGDEDRSQKPALPSAAPAPSGVIPSTHDSPSPSSRFRTKGELKGYTPLPTPSLVTKLARTIVESPPLSVNREELGGGEEQKEEEGEKRKRPIVPPGDIDGASALDILDWGSACNEFVEQLQTGKKRGRRKRTAGTVSAGSASGRSWPAIDSIETAVPEGSTTDLSAIPKEVLNSARSPLRLKAAQNGSESSSDEDKPLLLLRQQSQQQQQQKDQEEQCQMDSKAHAAFVQTDKAARNLREKQRFELQQKHEAKLGRSSSTDSETARAAFVAAQRAKARVRKLRHRSSVAATLSLKSSDGDGDVTADGAEDDRGKPGQKRVPRSLENSAKRKRIRGPGSRSSTSPSSSSSS
uniref:Uncharacterized protein n=1 Tax=Anopheles maculatus TaxID=74869 RepID=A0A182SUG5_9DIPT